MKNILSVNRKFMVLSPKELMDYVIEHSTCFDGVEICVDYKNPDEIKYLKELSFECQKNNKHFQVHGNSNASVLEQVEFLNMISEISKQLGYKIHVVLHSLSLNDKDDSIEATTEYLEEVTKLIDLEHIVIGLENLNNMTFMDRLDKDAIVPIVANDENIFLTYDIGHDLVEYGGITNLNEYLIPLITNVHIHSMNTTFSEGYDHKPILRNDPHWLEILKGISFLRTNHYEGPVVYEYDLYACPGDTIEERLDFYLDSMEYVSEHLK